MPIWGSKSFREIGRLELVAREVSETRKGGSRTPSRYSKTDELRVELVIVESISQIKLNRERTEGRKQVIEVWPA